MLSGLMAGLKELLQYTLKCSKMLPEVISSLHSLACEAAAFSPRVRGVPPGGRGGGGGGGGVWAKALGARIGKRGGWGSGAEEKKNYERGCFFCSFLRHKHSRAPHILLSSAGREPFAFSVPACNIAALNK